VRRASSPGDRAASQGLASLGLSARRAWLALPLHVAIVLVAAAIWLPFHADRLFNGLDGQYMLTLARDQWNWMPRGFALAASPLHGMGNIFYPMNMTLVPAMALQSAFAGKIDPALTYAAFSAEMFLAAFLLARSFALPMGLALAAGWGLILLALPYLHAPLINAGYQLSPQIADLLLMFAVFARLLTAARRRRDVLGAAAGIGVAIVPTAMLVQNPLMSMIFAPAMGMLFAGAVIGAAGVRRRLALAGWGVAAVLLAYFSGAIEFVVGNTLYTAAAYYAQELVSTQADLSHASMLFQGAAYPGGRIIVVLSTIGAALTVVLSSGERRWFAALHLAMAGAIVGVGVLGVTAFADLWRGPNGQYFEYALWPQYVAYSLAAPWWGMERLWPRLAAALERPRMAALVPLVLPIVAVASVAARPYRAPAQTYPPKPSAIVDALAREIAAAPGRPFRGYAATFTGMALVDRSINWHFQHEFDYAQVVPRLGNDHRFVGLWYFGIPTLNDYSQYTPPLSYLAASRLLARPGDTQARNVITYSRPDPALLQAWGVRYLIVDDTVDADFPVRAKAPLANKGRLRLLELPDPNLGGYAPRILVKVKDAGDALHRLGQGMDFRRTALIGSDENVAEPLGPVSSSELAPVRGGYRLRAVAPNRAMLVLPLLYSRCYNVESAPDAAAVRLVRANLLQIGVAFSGAIDIRLTFRSGPGDAARCRLDDLADARRLEIRDAARAVPRP